ncbi:MAG TPA: hypothetical protein PLY47_01970, partial [Rhodoglobus sp.]|jgi:hypothetical protein|nr:hypothetical protein [Rhodoglobus sp.]
MFPFMAAALALALSFAAPVAAPAPPDVPTTSVVLAPRMASPVAERRAPVIEWTITVDTIGYQDALDACLWTRMDFDGVVPIVGAHNFCGGDIVLDMNVGEIVHLVGAGVDGTYVVTGDRQVYPGDDAIEATAGLDSPVLLQTCYWDVDQGMRLVALSQLG